MHSSLIRDRDPYSASMSTHAEAEETVKNFRNLLRAGCAGAEYMHLPQQAVLFSTPRTQARRNKNGMTPYVRRAQKKRSATVVVTVALPSAARCCTVCDMATVQ